MIENFYINQIFEVVFNIGDQEMILFEKLSNDKNSLHKNTEYAKSLGFESRVVYGNIQNCFISYFVGECLPTKKVLLLSQTINYVKPVYAQNQLKLVCTVEHISESVNIIEFKFNFFKDTDLKVSSGKIKIKILK